MCILEFGLNRLNMEDFGVGLDYIDYIGIYILILFMDNFLIEIILFFK